MNFQIRQYLVNGHSRHIFYSYGYDYGERKITHYKKIKELVGWVVDNKSVFN